MKKNVIIILAILFSIGCHSQKKKTPVKKPVVAKGVFAKIDNLVVENKLGNFQITIDSKDAIVIKGVDSKFLPLDVKLTPFISNGTKLYALTWTEKEVKKTELKTENITTVNSLVYEIASKKQVFINTQLTNNIVEKVFLDRLKNASETQEKIRREGFEFIINPDGVIIQKNKTQENKWIFDATIMEFVDVKKKKK